MIEKIKIIIKQESKQGWWEKVIGEGGKFRVEKKKAKEGSREWKERRQDWNFKGKITMKTNNEFRSDVLHQSHI